MAQGVMRVSASSADCQENEEVAENNRQVALAAMAADLLAAEAEDVVVP